MLNELRAARLTLRILCSSKIESVMYIHNMYASSIEIATQTLPQFGYSMFSISPKEGDP